MLAVLLEAQVGDLVEFPHTKSSGVQARNEDTLPERDTIPGRDSPLRDKNDPDESDHHHIIAPQIVHRATPNQTQTSVSVLMSVLAAILMIC